MDQHNHGLALNVLLPLKKETQRGAAIHPRARSPGSARPLYWVRGRKVSGPLVTEASHAKEGVREVGNVLVLDPTWILAPGLRVLGSHQPQTQRAFWMVGVPISSSRARPGLSSSRSPAR